VRDQATDVFRQRLRGAIDASHGILRPESQRELEDIIAGKRPFTFVPWRLINLGLWMETFSVLGP
jgi:asparagine synthase (glutamine-hydrolysing)